MFSFISSSNANLNSNFVFILHILLRRMTRRKTRTPQHNFPATRSIWLISWVHALSTQSQRHFCPPSICFSHPHMTARISYLTFTRRTSRPAWTFWANIRMIWIMNICRAQSPCWLIHSGIHLQPFLIHKALCMYIQYQTFRHPQQLLTHWQRQHSAHT